MDEITQSLQRYLKSANLEFATLFNSDCGRKFGNPTSTTFHLTNKENDELTLDVIIDIFPESNQFFLTTHPRVVIDSEYRESLKAFEEHWNKSDRLTRLTTSKEYGINDLDQYCFQISTQGLCDPKGLTNYIWESYIALAETETFSVWEVIADFPSSDD